MLIVRIYIAIILRNSIAEFEWSKGKSTEFHMSFEDRFLWAIEKRKMRYILKA